MTEIHMIWAENNQGIIGNQGSIPWHLPEDLKHFKELTRGQTIIMGAATWESLPTKPLPGRRNIILSRRGSKHPGGETHPDLTSALAAAGENPWVIGGTQIYNLLMPHATHLHITHVDDNTPGDTPAPTVDRITWKTTNLTDWTESTTGLRYRYETLHTAAAPI